MAISGVTPTTMPRKGLEEAVAKQQFLPIDPVLRHEQSANMTDYWMNDALAYAVTDQLAGSWSVADLQQGVPNEAIIAAILGSDEYLLLVVRLP